MDDKLSLLLTVCVGTGVAFTLPGPWIPCPISISVHKYSLISISVEPRDDADGSQSEDPGRAWGVAGVGDGTVVVYIPDGGVRAG